MKKLLPDFDVCDELEALPNQNSQKTITKRHQNVLPKPLPPTSQVPMEIVEEDINTTPCPLRLGNPPLTTVKYNHTKYWGKMHPERISEQTKKSRNSCEPFPSKTHTSMKLSQKDILSPNARLDIAIKEWAFFLK